MFRDSSHAALIAALLGSWACTSEPRSPHDVTPEEIRREQERLGELLRRERTDCDQGDKAACGRAGHLILRGGLRSGDPAQGVQLLRSSCAAGNAFGCHWLGIAHLDARGVAFSTENALRFLKRGCELGHVDSCVSAARNDDLDLAQKLALHERACALGDEQTCSRITCLREPERCPNGAQEPEPEAPPATRAIVARCRAGDGPACLRAGRLHIGRARGAADLFRHGCTLGHSSSCLALAALYEMGIEVPRDGKRAQRMREGLCDSKFGPACTEAGFAYSAGFGRPRDEIRALEFFGRACDLGDAGGCESGAGLTERSERFGWDRHRALEWWQRGCAHEKRLCEEVNRVRRIIERSE